MAKTKKISVTLPIATPDCDPIPDSPGVEGHGQGLKHDTQTYYYRVGKLVPRDKIVHLTYEGAYMGRVHGEKEYIVVAFDGEQFRVLEHVSYYGVKDVLQKFKGMTNAEAIAAVVAIREEIAAKFAALPKCKCGNQAGIIFDERQKKDECLTCMNKRLKLK